MQVTGTQIPSKGDQVEQRRLGVIRRGYVWYADQLQVLVKWEDGKSSSLRLGSDLHLIATAAVDAPRREEEAAEAALPATWSGPISSRVLMKEQASNCSPRNHSSKTSKIANSCSSGVAPRRGPSPRERTGARHGYATHDEASRNSAHSHAAPHPRTRTGARHGYATVTSASQIR